MKNNFPKISVIILNWNSWKDTIECLESVFKNKYSNIRVILFENGSENDSFNNILKWASGKSKLNIETNFYSYIYPHCPKPLEFEIIKSTSLISQNYLYDSLNSDIKFYILKSKENLGFAIANNIAMKFAEQNLNSDFYFLLNNDTVIHPNTFSPLIEEFKKDIRIGVAQSVIYHYDQPNVIANAGGIILPWGQTKYYKRISARKVKNISFVNGCALMISADIPKKYGFLSEKFFFGEEDFEFSMRMKNNHVKMVSIAGSIVYHKIGATKKEFMKVKKQLFLHGLNRIIDCKDFYSPYVWNIWKECMLLYFFVTILLRHKFKIHDAYNLINELRKNSRIYTDVKKNTLEKIFNSSNIWKHN